MKPVLVLSRIVVASLTVVVAVQRGQAASFFLSPATSPGSVTQSETAAINIAGGGSGSLGIWSIPDAQQVLAGIVINLRIDETSGNAIDFTSVTIHNPVIAAGPAKRWFDDPNIPGVGVESVDDDLVTGMSGVTSIGLGIPGEGTGLDAANGADDPLYDSGSGAYLFATVDYDVINTSDSANLYLQIGDGGISDANGLISSVIFGLSDPPLDASDLNDRNVDSATEDATVSNIGTDVDGNGIVNGGDLLVVQRDDPANIVPWRLDYGGPGSLVAAVAGTAIPEPSALILLLVGVFGSLVRRRRS